MTTAIGTEQEWSGSCDPCDPANYWIDDETGERVNAVTNERSEHQCPSDATYDAPDGWKDRHGYK